MRVTSSSHLLLANWPGDHFLPQRYYAFLLTVGLPLITIVAVAVAGGSWGHLTKDLPKQAATIMAVLIFIIIGPAFAAPRAGLVAYEMAVKPFFIDASQLTSLFFDCIFCGSDVLLMVAR